MHTIADYPRATEDKQTWDYGKEAMDGWKKGSQDIRVESLKKIDKDTDRDYYMSAEEAKEYGIVDEVIEVRK